MERIYSIRLNEKEERLLSRLAEQRQASRADVFRWLLIEAGRVFLVDEPGSRVEDEGRNDDYPNVPI